MYGEEKEKKNNIITEETHLLSLVLHFYFPSPLYSTSHLTRTKATLPPTSDEKGCQTQIFPVTTRMTLSLSLPSDFKKKKLFINSNIPIGIISSNALLS